MGKPAPATIRLSTDDFPERERIEGVRELYGRSIIKVDLEPAPGRPFRFEATLNSLPGLKCAAGVVSPVRASLTRELINADDLLFNINLTGSRSQQQRGREVLLGAGDAGLTTNADPGVVTVHSTSRFISFRIPRKELQPMIGDLDASLLRLIPRNTAALRLLRSYAGLLRKYEAVSELNSLVAAHFRDLIAVTLGASRDAAETAGGRGIRAARLHAIKTDIFANLIRADLSVDAVAARHGISPRYLGMLFAGEQTSFSQFVLASRLERAHRQLCNPYHTEQSVSAIAFSCGFGDLSYFNRTFRRRYGMTPSDTRQATKHGAGD
jgi:AraC-like DNA-binding protein